jgi:hypothetical protein
VDAVTCELILINRRNPATTIRVIADGDVRPAADQRSHDPHTTARSA